MTIDVLLAELNQDQRNAATWQHGHALVLAGAGCGKTKTIIARAAFLIASGVPPSRIQILTFTRRSAAEIVERVRLHLGESASGLRASTFHTWCMSLLRRAPSAFGSNSMTVIDRDDQIQLFRVFRGRKPEKGMPTAATLCNIYSLARNTGLTLEDTLLKHFLTEYNFKIQIGAAMMAYEARKRERRYLDYDDILDVVAHQLEASPQTCAWVCGQYDHILVDEMQDTNPLQWRLLNPVKETVKLFCVGDDAQSIYAFRGADFRNVHSFADRVPGAATLKLERNYRSTQEILDISNWLLAESTLNYDKSLLATRGSGHQPQLRSFSNEWEEGRWIAEDLLERRMAGAEWRQHMILVRSGLAARQVEAALLAQEIPYVFIGGVKLMESAHVRDLLSLLRLVANPQDEIAWMRFLTLWDGVGDVTAGKAINEILTQTTVEHCLTRLDTNARIPSNLTSAIRTVIQSSHDVSAAVTNALAALNQVLSSKYEKQDWDKRRRDFSTVIKLAEQHTSILEFIEQYVLDPVFDTEVNRKENDDVVKIITIHSAKGMEADVCYVINVSPGAYPSQYAAGDEDDVEEERRVLYVAFTRARNELIITRQGHRLSAVAVRGPSATADVLEVEAYFLNNLPAPLVVEFERPLDVVVRVDRAPPTLERAQVGISLGFSLPKLESDPPVIYVPPTLVTANIEAMAKKEYPDNPIMQAQTRTKQSEAHEDLGHLRKQAEKHIDLAHACEKAIASACDDYILARLYARQQIEEFEAWQNTSAPDVPHEMIAGCKKFATTKHPDDFFMRRHTLNEQLCSYRLVQLHVSDVPPEVVEEARALATKKYPHDQWWCAFVFKEHLFNYREIGKFRVTQESSNEVINVRTLTEPRSLHEGGLVFNAEVAREEASLATAQDAEFLSQIFLAGTSLHEDIQPATHIDGEPIAVLENLDQQLDIQAIDAPEECLSLEERWERSTAEATAVTAAKAALLAKVETAEKNELFGPYESQLATEKYPRDHKEHLSNYRELDQLHVTHELSNEAVDVRMLIKSPPLQEGALIFTAEVAREEALLVTAQDKEFLPQLFPAGALRHENIQSALHTGEEPVAVLEYPKKQGETQAFDISEKSISLEERWERSRGEAKAVTAAKAALAAKAEMTVKNEFEKVRVLANEKSNYCEFEQLLATQKLSNEAIDMRTLTEPSLLQEGALISIAEVAYEKASLATAPNVEFLSQIFPTGASMHEDIHSAKHTGAEPVEKLKNLKKQCDTQTVDAPAKSISLEERWERSRTEAKAVTAAKKELFYPYASQRHNRGRKSHLAALINQNIHDHPAMGCVWFVIFAILIVGSFILANFK